MIRRIFRFVKELLGELSDQSAYSRHLSARGAAHSGDEWRRFCDHRWEAKARRGRCC